MLFYYILFCRKFQIGDRVMALLSGGGNAEYVAAHIDHLMAIPERLSFDEAAAVPEVWLTAFQLFDRICK
jgi:tumor protein p53-inducible protein 3